MINKTLKFYSGQEIPSLGFGTWQLEGETATKAVEIALEVGYRHIDTAIAYYNHQFIKPAIAQSGLKREELFITSKLWRDFYHKKDAVDAGKKALDDLGVEYLDLFLIHWPDRNVPIMETLDALFELKNEGLIKEWGVSNFTIHHLKDIIERGIEVPNNQVEFHPSLNQKELKEFCDQFNILMTAYSPIAQGKDLQLPVIQELAKKYDKTPSQIILNWIISKGMVAIPKGSGREHIEENFHSTDFELSEDDIQKIDAIGGEMRIVLPDFNEFDY